MLGVCTLGSKGRVVLPLALRQELGLTAGTQLRVKRTDDGAYELVPTGLVPWDQRYYHTAEMRERVERAERSFGEWTSTGTEGEAATARFLESLTTP